ncbi:MAG: hypothetical protein ACREBU_04280 [Nitrososphaera sp.]
MPLQVNFNSSAPASASAPDGTAAFPLGQAAVSPYPLGAVPVHNSSGNAANAVASASVSPGSGDLTAYLTGFEITGSGATAALPVTVTVVGVLGGTLSYTYVFVAGVTLANTPLIVQFALPLKASSMNTTITVSCPASGSGGTNNTVTAHGFKMP